jgi:hypothetical protein
MNHRDYLNKLEAKHFIFKPSATQVYSEEKKFVGDSQPLSVTFANGGTPAMLTTGISAELINILVAPMRSVELFGETQKGNWLTSSMLFPVIEHSGTVGVYDDYSDSGSSDANMTWPNHQPIHFQTSTRYGERQIELAALSGHANWPAQLDISSAMALNKYANAMNFFGVAGLKNYGALNHPQLSTPLVSPVLWNVPATQPETLAEAVRAMFVQAITQTMGAVDVSSPCQLIMYPSLQAAFSKVNSYGISAHSMIEKEYPGLRVATAPEYLSVSGVYTIQLVFDSINGQKVMETAFTEKMRTHGVIRKAKSWEETKSRGGYGTIIYMPMGIVQMTTAG